jgi:ABC-type methionine transport system permease subunit
MYNYPIAQAAPLINAFLQSLLLLVCPLVISAIVGGTSGMWLFFRRHPLFARRARLRFSAVKPLPYARSMIYLGLMPMLLLLMRNIPGLTGAASVILLLSMGAAVYLAYHVYGGLHTLDASILEMALASGLDRQEMIMRVLLPLGKNSLLHALCETALFLLAMGAVSGCVAGGGLTGLAVQGGLNGTDALTMLLSLLLLAAMFLFLGRLSSRFAGKCGKPS